MDLSSLPEAEQQQLQQLHQQFKEHQAQQQQQQHQQQQYQQQQQQYQNYSYDPTQVQSYDQSTQAYYSYYQQHDQQQQQQQQHYGYYQHDYDYSAYQQPPHQHPELVPVNPPALSLSNESAAQIPESGGAGDSVQQQNAYYSGQQVQGPMPPGLNPAAAAAVAALSQLTQFAGTMDAAERAMAGLHPKVEGFGPMAGPMHYVPGPMRPPVGWSPYGGGGRRGGGRGNFGHQHPRSGSSGPPFGGKGRNRGRGRHRRFPPHGSSSSSRPEPSTAGDAELTDGEAEPSANLPEEADQSAVPPEASQSAPAIGKVAPNRRPPQGAWCELCRVDCTSLEILEQHKNGKRHKKNLQRIGELKIAVKPGIEIQNQQNPIAKSEPEGYQQAESAQECEVKVPAETVSAETVNDENKMDSEQQNNTEEQPEVTSESSKMQAQKPRLDRFDNHRRGMKRKMRGGRGGKRMRTFEAPRRPNEPPKPKVVIPLICDLCSVKCDTQEVFDRHLSGKKHIAKLKRFEGHQAMYGPVGLQALYPPNPIAQTLFLPQSHQQQFYDSQGSYPPPGAYMPPQIHQAPPAAAVLDPRFQQNPNPQYLGVAPEVGSQNAVALAPEAPNQFTVMEPEIRHAVTVEANQPTNGCS